MTACAALLVAPAGTAEADGTETLGPPSIRVAEGTGMAVAGTGLFDQPGTIEVTVPDGAAVRQVLLYWEGQHLGTGDDTLVVGGREVTGTRIGGPTRFFGRVHSTSYRADITDLGLVTAGTSRVQVRGADFDARKNGQFRNNGAGLVVIYDEGTAPADIRIRDGNDLAFHKFDPPLDAMVPQTYEFDAAPVERTAVLSLFASSVGENRPTAIDVTVAGETRRFCDRFGETSGPEWSTTRLPVTIPAGADELTVEARSLRCPDTELTGQPGSIAWSTSALFVPPPAAEQELALEVVKLNDADRDGTFSDEEQAPAVGESVAFAVRVSNPGSGPVVLDRLIDAFGDVEVDLLTGTAGGAAPELAANACDELGGITLEPGRTRICHFTLARYSPPAGERLLDTVTVTGHRLDAPDRGVTASDTSVVTSPAGAVLPARVGLGLTKTNDADGDGAFSDVESAPRAGAAVPFEVTVSNPSTAAVIVDGLTDGYGDVEVDLLAGAVRSGEASLVANSCADLDGARLEAGERRICRFTLRGYSPPGGESLVDTVRVTGHLVDRPGHSLEAADDSTVRTPGPGGEPGGAARLPRTGVRTGWLGLLATVLLGGGAGLLRLGRERPEGASRGR